MGRLSQTLQALALVLAAAGAAAVAVTVASARSHMPVALAPTPRPTVRAGIPTPAPSVVPGPLNGLPTARHLAMRRPVAAIVDNFYPDARPQAGLSSASLVFETVVEGGVTRLMPIYLEHDAGQIGPIRSARPYFVAWAAGFRALLVHDGGSPAALRMLRRVPAIGDVNAVTPSPGFSRATDRLAPHDLFGSTAGVRAAAQRHGWPVWLQFPALLHRPGKGLGKAVTTLSLDFSAGGVASAKAYAVTYRYDATSNRYLRFQGSIPDRDATTGTQVAVRNVVVLETDIAAIKGDPEGRMSVRTTGSGRAYYFVHGHATRGTWSKEQISAPLRLLDSRGKPAALDPGSTWIEVIGGRGLHARGL